MRVAFYAPLKSPAHPVPSGDRLLARAFVAALERGGHEVALASRLRTWDRRGDEARQQRIARVGEAIARRLVRRWRGLPSEAPQLWFTYHVYHKAPDPIGPHVCDALAIPYVVAEASVAAKQRQGPWRAGFEAATAAIRRADEVLCINPADARGVASIRGDAVVQLPPFFDVDAFLGTSPLAVQRAAVPRLIVAAMMRPGNKLASFRLLAEALAKIEHVPWHLVVVGTGEAASEVSQAFARFPSTRLTFAGAVPHESMARMLADGDIFVWPAVDEVIGMALLEAQACGLPVVAGRGPGVAAVVADGVGGVLVEHGNAKAFASATEALIRDHERRTAMSDRARAYVRRHHDIPAAAQAIDAVLRRALDRRRNAHAT